MRTQTISLDVVDIASPCPASWDAMRGDDHVRFCGECNLHVYNISEMSREAATALIAQREGRLCVRMYRREDGTLITNDCGRLRAAAKRAARWSVAAATVVLSAALTLLLSGGSQTNPRRAQASFDPLAMLRSWLMPKARPAMLGEATVMGDVRMPATQPTTQPATQPTVTMGIMAPPQR